MEAWDRAVATMKKGETSKFTVPEMYLSGGPDCWRKNLPDDGQDVIFEFELVAVRPITDLFGDGGVIQNLLEESDDYGQSPKTTDEVQIHFITTVKVSDEETAPLVEQGQSVDFRMASPSLNNMLCAKAIHKALLSMKAGTSVRLVCRSDYAAGDQGDEERGVPPKASVVVCLSLLQIYEFDDAGKKASWEENLVVRKAIVPIRNRLCPGWDGTWCKVKIKSVKVGEEEKLGEEMIVNTIVGKGELCDALEAASARMRKGEVALITVKPIPSLHAPGAPDLEISGTANVVYNVEMIDFGNPPPEEGPSDSTDLLEFCKKQKEQGSAHFKSGRIRLAYERYSRVVALTPRYKRPLGSSSSVEVFEDPEERREAEELKKTCRLNLAACALKLDLAYSASRFCDEVLKEEPGNIKALYRRAQGLLGSNDFEEAVRDCKSILELEPTNKDARLLMQKVKQAEKEQLKKQKERFGASLARELA
ncbi:FKBP62 [Symbiodinium pilosum]|uniref:peptidylprolyl isomerase n=1 Tax=Symbiodinium pilosum TaxID=2952 RepID=A0A812SZ95_SYMPI|nr:FKBP62 [Symbiodinium pilosum]